MLANETSNATKHIERIIESIRDDTSIAETALASVTEEVGRATQNSVTAASVAEEQANLMGQLKQTAEELLNS